MEVIGGLLQWAQNVAFLAVGAWALWTWSRRRDRQSAWLALTFLGLATVVLLGIVTELLVANVGDAAVTSLIRAISVTMLVFFPYLLLRFQDEIAPIATWFQRTVLVVVVVQAVLGLVAPGIGDPEAASTAPVLAFLLLVVGTWTVVLPTVAVRFWRGGRGHPTLVRARLRTLAIATGALSLALILAAASPGEEVTVMTIATQLAAVVSSVMFLLGFAPPSIVKVYARRGEERRLHEASVSLLGATRPQEVAELLVPHLRDVVAAEGVALLHRGAVLAADGVDRDRLDAAGAGHDDAPVRVQLRTGAVLVWTGSYTPFFADEELELLDRLALLADLALERTELLESERAVRAELEEVNVELVAANADLESFVYTASHDLKSPLVAVQSYTDVLEVDYGHVLDEQGRWYLERMRGNCAYMSALVGDLLELSRVGRVDAAPETVPVADVLEELREEVVHRFPQATLDVIGDMPVVWCNRLRVGQLLRNLVENAAIHGAPDGVRIEVAAHPAPGDNGVVLTVTDDGPGIDPEHRERIFGVFERLDAGAEGSGTGIGLAICQKIVTSFGGGISVTDHEGGAQFAVRFPPGALAGGNPSAGPTATDAPARTSLGATP